MDTETLEVKSDLKKAFNHNHQSCLVSVDGVNEPDDISSAIHETKQSDFSEKTSKSSPKPQNAVTFSVIGLVFLIFCK